MAALSATEDPEILLNLLNMTIHREESGIRLQVKRFICIRQCFALASIVFIRREGFVTIKPFIV
jgi:hypothetical protein